MLKPINSGQAARIPLKDLWQIDTNKTKIINITKTYATVIDISSQLEPPVKPANGVYSREECIYKYCPTPDLCKAKNKCLKCRHLNIVKYCKNCKMDIQDEDMDDCLICREKLNTKCEDCLGVLD